MALDAKTWLIENGLDEATASELAPRFTPAALQSIEGGYLRQSDYSAKMNDLQRSQTDLANANQRLTDEMTEWATAQATGATMTAKQQRDLEAAQAKVAMLTTRVTNIAAQAGIDSKVALEGLEAPAGGSHAGGPPQNTPPGFDASKFVPADEYRQNYGQITKMALELPAELFNLATEHQQLYGTPLDAKAITTEIMTRAQTRGNQKSLDPRTVWEELHNVPAKRTEVATAKHDAEIKAAEERGRQAAITESSVPGSVSAPGNRALVFNHGERKSAIARPQPQSTVNAAVAAMRSGKYKTPTPGTK